MSSEVYLGNFLAIVIQNNDPEKRGRVKVFIPHLSATIYDNWNKDKTDKNFTFPDKDTNPDLDTILPYLKKTLPWAEVACPIFGGSASGKYNAYLRKGTTSDSNYWENNELVEGFRPVQNFINENRLQDAFAQANEDDTRSRFVNPYSAQYSPSDYSNLSRGIFSPINVGAHVWVFFENGDPQVPVVFAVSHGEEDWKRIYSMNKDEDSDFVSQDYPASFENYAQDEGASLNHDTKTFRSKHVFNSNKHVIELVDTDHREILKMTHYSGSFFEMNNATNTMFASNNDQKMVLGDQFLTVKRNQAVYIANYQEITVDGDRIINLGDFKRKRKYARRILTLLREIHKHKRLFEIDRTDANIPYTSPYQEKNGDFDKCPVCQGEGEKFDMPCITCGGSGDSPSTQWGDWEDNGLKWDPKNLEDEDEDVLRYKMSAGEVPQLIKTLYFKHKEIKQLELEGNFGNGGDDIVTIAGNRVTTIGTVFNDLGSFRIDPIGKIRDSEAHIGKSGSYIAMHECPLVEYVDVDSVPGGDWDVTVCNKYRLHVGSKGIHIKTTGPLDIYGTIVNLTGESLNISSDWEVLIDGGKRVEIRGDVINLKPHSAGREYINLDGNVGVRNNLTVVGGAHIEGELTYLHATTPKVRYETEVGYGPQAHSHSFYGPPWTLMDECDQVREAAQKANRPTPTPNMKCAGFWVPA